MNDITKIPTDEMVDDYFASRLERDACAKLLAVANDRQIDRLTERVNGNEAIMRVIAAELLRRGELGRIQAGEND